MLSAVSTEVRFAAVVETAALTDSMALLRLTASADNARLNAPSTEANDADALLNPLDSDATALPRATVSVDRAVLNPESTVARDGIAVLLNDVIALIRVDVSLDTPDFNALTLLSVLALIVRLGLV